MRELTTAFSVLHILFLCLSGAIQLIMTMTPLGESQYGAVALGSPIWMQVVPNLLALLLLLLALWYFARLVKGLPASTAESVREADVSREEQEEVQVLRQRLTYLEDQMDSMQTMLLERY